MKNDQEILKGKRRISYEITTNSPGTYTCVGKNALNTAVATTQVSIVKPPNSCEYLSNNLSDPPAKNLLWKFYDPSSSLSNLAKSKEIDLLDLEDKSGQIIVPVGKNELASLLTGQFQGSTCQSYNRHGQKISPKYNLANDFREKILRNYNTRDIYDQNSLMSIESSMGPILQESSILSKKYFTSDEKIVLDCFLSMNYKNLIGEGKYEFTWIDLDSYQFPVNFRIEDTSEGQSLIALTSNNYAVNGQKIRCSVENTVTNLKSIIEQEIVITESKTSSQEILPRPQTLNLLEQSEAGKIVIYTSDILSIQSKNYSNSVKQSTLSKYKNFYKLNYILMYKILDYEKYLIEERFDPFYSENQISTSKSPRWEINFDKNLYSNPIILAYYYLDIKNQVSSLPSNVFSFQISGSLQTENSSTKCSLDSTLEFYSLQENCQPILQKVTSCQNFLKNFNLPKSVNTSNNKCKYEILTARNYQQSKFQQISTPSNFLTKQPIVPSPKINAVTVHQNLNFQNCKNNLKNILQINSIKNVKHDLIFENYNLLEISFLIEKVADRYVKLVDKFDLILSRKNNITSSKIFDLKLSANFIKQEIPSISNLTENLQTFVVKTQFLIPQDPDPVKQNFKSAKIRLITPYGDLDLSSNFDMIKYESGIYKFRDCESTFPTMEIELYNSSGVLVAKMSEFIDKMKEKPIIFTCVLVIFGVIFGVDGTSFDFLASIHLKNTYLTIHT